jgi:hypothetical protein
VNYRRFVRPGSAASEIQPRHALSQESPEARAATRMGEQRALNVPNAVEQPHM